MASALLPKTAIRQIIARVIIATVIAAFGSWMIQGTVAISQTTVAACIFFALNVIFELVRNAKN